MPTEVVTPLGVVTLTFKVPPVFELVHTNVSATCVASLVMDILNAKAPLPAATALPVGQAGENESRQAILLGTIKLDGGSIVPLDDVNTTVVPTGMVLPFTS